MPATDRRRPSAGIEIHPRYGLLTLAYMAGIYGLSSLPDLGVSGSDTFNSRFQVASNLFHIPLYAGLAFSFLRAISAGQGGSWGRDGLTLLGTGSYAALDEWHQSFVPGRYASVNDVFLDLVGISGMLLILRLGTLREMGS